MGRLAAAAARPLLALAVALLLLALLRLPPVFAETPLGVRALPLAGLAVLLAAIVSLGARVVDAAPSLVRARRAGAVVAAALAALALCVVWRGDRGIPAIVSDPRGAVGRLDAGPLEVSGPRLHALPAVRRWTFAWRGALDAPTTGVYRLWATGRGALELRLDGRVALAGEGDGLLAASDLALQEGPHTLEATLTRVGPGPRLRVGWTRPGTLGPVAEPLPPRALDPGVRPLWRAIDALALLASAALGLWVLALPWPRVRPLPAPRPVTRSEIAWSAAGLAAVLAVMSWPLVTDPAGLGVTDRPDGRLNAWILAWDAHALAHEPGRLWSPPVFHPLPDALTFSENLLLPAVAAAPALALGGPVFGYNVALLLSLLLSGLGAQLLVRRVSGGRTGAFAAGALFAAGPHRWIRLSHLHAQATPFLPFALLALDHHHERPTLRRGLLVGLLFALQAYCSVYVGAITACALAAAIGLGVLHGWRGRHLLPLAAGGLLAAAMLAPLAAPYLRMRAFQGMEWTLEDVRTYATTLQSYGASGTRLWGGLTQREMDPDVVQDTLFPGATLLVAGLLGLAVAPRRYRAVALAASAVAIVVSLGPETAFYRFLHEHVVLVRSVRALSRFSLIPVLALCVTSGLAVARRPRLAAAMLLLALAESSNVPIRYARAEPPSAAARWLAGREGAVAYVPLGDGDTQAMLDGLAHLRPLVNGDSGFIPRPYARTMTALDPPLGEDARRLLRGLGVTHVVGADLDLPEVARFGAERVYGVPPGDAARVVPEGVPRPTLFSREGTVVEVGIGALEAVTFEMDDRPWLERPRVEVSPDGLAWSDVAAASSLADATLTLYADPRHGRGEVRFARVAARFVRLDPALPARTGPFGVH